MAFQLEIPGNFSRPKRRLAALLCAMPFLLWFGFLLLTLAMSGHIREDQAEGYGWMLLFGIGFSLINVLQLALSGLWLWGSVNAARKGIVVVLALNALCLFLPALLVAAFCVPVLMMKSDLPD